MATYYSDNFAATADATYTASYRRDSTKTHARMRKKRMEATITTTAANDIISMGTFKSGDRLYDLQLSTTVATPTTGTIEVGLSKASLDHTHVDQDANVIDEDLFASAQLVTAAVTRVDMFVEAGTLADFDRGKTLWELATIGDGSYTVDPMEDWDLVLNCTAAINGAQGIILEADYVSFG